jgi:hypothetical protein
MKCPKCGQEQIPNDACTQCGIVFAKYYEIQKRKADAQSLASKTGNSQNTPTANKLETVPDTLFQRLFLPWKPVSTPAMVALSVGFSMMVYLLATESLLDSGSTILYLTHNVNLVFHEAGHWIFGVFGNDTLAIFGGSLNQVLIPVIVAVSFWTKRDAVGFAFGLFWCFENLLDVAVYMADARALVLPLIGGLGEDAHDWRNLFFRFGLIDQDIAIATKTRVVGWIGIIATWTWFLWRWLIDRKPSHK